MNSGCASRFPQNRPVESAQGLRAPSATQRFVVRTALLISLLVSVPAQAQEVAHEPQTWLALFSQGPLVGQKLVLWFDAHARFGFAPESNPANTALLIRPGVGYRLREDMTIYLGYLWAPVWRSGQLTLNEHRVWQQYTWDLAFDSGAKMQLRSRLEERFAQGDVGLRFRQLVRAQTPPLVEKFILVAWDEVFLAFNNTRFGQLAGFDQNRLFLGVGRSLWGKFRLEAGYFNQWLPREGTDPMRHAFAVNLYAGW